ncbi:MAG: HAD family hydrolase [Planctomycetota bacterium]|jgi:phosphoglycolate phosphatase
MATSCDREYLPVVISETVSPAAVLFDLDGTLADTLEDIMAALNATRREAGLAPVDDTALVRSWVGRGAPRLMACSLGEGADPETVHELVTVFRGLYPALSGRHARPMPGVVALLDALRARGVPLAVTTNKPRAATLTLLDALALRDRFQAVLTPDDVEDRTKPDPAMLVEAARRLGVDVADCLLVGDGTADVEAARACGMPVAVVLDGYSPPDELRSAGADLYFATIRDLKAHLGD